MAWKNIKQRSLAESMLIEHDAIKELDEIYSLIDWSRIERLLADVYSSPRGNKAWPPIMMFRALLLQSWYKLSDEGLEKQWACDVLFSAFYWFRHIITSTRQHYYLALQTKAK